MRRCVDCYPFRTHLCPCLNPKKNPQISSRIRRVGMSPKSKCKAIHAERRVRALRTASSVLGIVLGTYVASYFLICLVTGCQRCHCLPRLRWRATRPSSDTLESVENALNLQLVCSSRTVAASAPHAGQQFSFDMTWRIHTMPLNKHISDGACQGVLSGHTSGCLMSTRRF